MKNTYRIKFRFGLMGDALVTAVDEDEAAREAFSLCRYHAACIPRGYGAKDIVESAELTDLRPGTPGYVYRPVVEKMTHGDWARKNGQRESFSPLAAERAV